LVFFANPRHRDARKSPRSDNAMATLLRSPHMNENRTDLSISKESR